MRLRKQTDGVAEVGATKELKADDLIAAKEPLAIIGMSCRLPGGSNSTEELWEMLAEGRSGWVQGAGDRFQSDAFYHPAAELGGVFNAQGFHFLTQDLAKFDAQFFNISPMEAKAMDPQQRLLLEIAYEAFENAGIPLDKLQGSKTGVYIAGFNSDYERMLSRDPENAPSYRLTGTGIAIMSNRISYAFDLAGPSFTLDTGCSGSLVALHQACHGIRNGEIDQALVGGTNLILDPEMTSSLSSLKLLGDNGRCFAFDTRAQGYGRGEGVGAVLVKSLSKALEDGDNIRAVIRNTAVNQDGRTLGITMPNSGAQKSMMWKAYADVGLDPSETNYIEAHGTGTEVGDAAEAEAITSVFTKGRKTADPLVVGSIKSNIGHTESMAGLAGLIKTVLMLEKGKIVPNYDFKQLSKRLPVSGTPIQVPVSLTHWPSNGMRRASVNSFGYGGTNGHVILDSIEDFLSVHGLPMQKMVTASHHNQVIPHLNRELDPKDAGRKPHHDRRLVIFSGNSRETLRKTIENLKAYASARTETNAHILEDLAYTLCCRRSLLPFRLHRNASTIQELLDSLTGSDLDEELAKTQKAIDRPSVCYVFNGQGAQWAGMARELLGTFLVFDRSITNAEACMKRLGADWSLKEELLKPAKVSNINKASMSQVLCTAVQIGLIDLLNSWGIRPNTVVGHSSGEIAAAYAAGALSFEDALCVTYHRGAVMAKSDRTSQGVRGAMLAVGLPADDALGFIEDLPNDGGQVCVACINSPSSVTIAGDRPQILALQELLEKQKVFNRLLVVDKAYHSYHMHPIYDEYLQALTGISPRQSNNEVRILSTVFGDDVDGQDLDATYWARNSISPVRFSEALGKICTEHLANDQAIKAVDGLIIEIGPHSSLAGPIKQIQRSLGSNMKYESALIRNVDASRTVLDMVGSLCANGVEVDLSAVNAFRRPKLLGDYPPYAWDHSTYWHESRFSKQFLHRQYPRHSLLGVLSPDNNPLEPRWRNYIRVADIPWVSGHALQGNILYPASGFICMAIEAARQQARMTNGTERNCLFVLREVNITRALLIPNDSQGVETVFSLRPYPQSARSSSAIWNEFRVFSVSSSGDWGEHCRGIMSVQPHVSVDEVEGNRENEASGEIARRKFAAAHQDCTTNIDPSTFYEHLKSISMNYDGPFRGLEKISTAPMESLCRFKIPDVQAKMPAAFDQPHCLHPATLDLCIQTILPALRAVGKLNAPTVLNYVKELTVVSDVESSPGTEFETNLTAKQITSSRFMADINVQEASEMKPPLKITGKGLVYTSVPTGSDDAEDTLGDGHKLCHRLEWMPDVIRTRPQDAQRLCNSILSHEYVVDPLDRFNDRARHIIDKTLSSLSQEDEERLLPHQRLYVGWMRKNTSISDRHIISEPVDHLGPLGEMLERMNSHLGDILVGKVDPLTIMMDGDLLYRWYSNNDLSRCVLQISEYVRMLSWKNPRMKVLEIGAGTGSATVPILKACFSNTDQSGGPGLDQYTFTDISTGFFEKAKELLAPWLEILRFQKLDIERAPSEQGFDDGLYDVVIAVNVLHATSSINKTMRNVRSLLKPGGRLCIVEITQQFLFENLVFGTLPGWWLGAAEDHRTETPLLTVEKWSATLSCNGFSGNDLWLPDHSLDEKQDQHYSAMISTAVAESLPVVLPPIEIITAVDMLTEPEPVGAERSFVRAICENFKDFAQPNDAREITLHDLRPEDKVIIVLLEMVRPFLASCDEVGFEKIKRMFSTAKGVVWVTSRGTGDCSNPLNALSTGLTRSARSENRLTKVLTVDVASPRESSLTVASLLFELVRDTLLNPEARLIDSEYVLNNGVTLVPRLVEDAELNQSIGAGEVRQTPKEELFFQDERILEWSIATPGLLETMAWQDAVHNEALAHDEIRIELRYGAINFRDLMVALGQLESFPRFADECSGVVLELGTSARSSFQVGDRVCAVGGGAYASSSVVKMHNACKLPNTMSFEIGASIPIAYTTAYYSLHTVANLRAGESILIHSAAGGLGQAAVMIAQHFGAVVFVTVGNSKKKSFMMENFKIPEDHIFSSRLTKFSRGIQRLTNGKGVDVILNSLAADTVRESCACIGKFGRFIEVGKRDAAVNARLDMEMFGRHVMFAAVDLALIYGERPLLFADLLRYVVNLVAQKRVGSIRPLEIKELGEIEEAFRLMQTGKHMGKILLKAEASTRVKVLPPPPPQATFRGDGWYVVAGGVGGLGQAIISWMAHLGARNIIAISRSGNSHPKSSGLAERMKSVGVNLIIHKADITDTSQVRSILDFTEGQPVVGVIQGAMALNDIALDSMSFKQWQTTVGPKVQGTVNLYDVLGNSLEFFVMLSSVIGLVGAFGQSNYAAGNTFQDAFARSVHSQGHPVRSLDLGGIAGAGYVAEHAESVGFLQRQGAKVVELKKFLALLNHVIAQPFSPSLSQSQLFLGLDFDERVDSHRRSDGKFSHIYAQRRHKTVRQPDNVTVDVAKGLRDSKTQEQALQLVTKGILAKLSQLLAMDAQDLSPNQSMARYGSDSLVAVELRNWLAVQLQAQVQTLELLGAASIHELSTTVISRSKIVPASLIT